MPKSLDRATCPVCAKRRERHHRLRPYGIPRHSTWCGCDSYEGLIGFFSKKTERQETRTAINAAWAEG